jgi:hypothetical protein
MFKGRIYSDHHNLAIYIIWDPLFFSAITPGGETFNGRDTSSISTRRLTKQMTMTAMMKAVIKTIVPKNPPTKAAVEMTTISSIVTWMMRRAVTANRVTVTMRVCRRRRPTACWRTGRRAMCQRRRYRIHCQNSPSYAVSLRKRPKISGGGSKTELDMSDSVKLFFIRKSTSKPVHVT